MSQMILVKCYHSLDDAFLMRNDLIYTWYFLFLCLYFFSFFYYLLTFFVALYKATYSYGRITELVSAPFHGCVTFVLSWNLQWHPSAPLLRMAGLISPPTPTLCILLYSGVDRLKWMWGTDGASPGQHSPKVYVLCNFVFDLPRCHILKLIVGNRPYFENLVMRRIGKYGNKSCLCNNSSISHLVYLNAMWHPCVYCYNNSCKGVRYFEMKYINKNVGGGSIDIWFIKSWRKFFIIISIAGKSIKEKMHKR